MLIIIRDKKKRRLLRQQKRLKRNRQLYATVGEAIDDNPECRFVVVATLYEEDIYLGPIEYMPVSVRDRRVKGADIDNETLLLLT